MNFAKLNRMTTEEKIEHFKFLIYKNRECALGSDISEVVAFLDNVEGVDINVKLGEEDNYRFINFAVRNMAPAIVQLLIERGAETQATIDDNGNIFATYAIAKVTTQELLDIGHAYDSVLVKLSRETMDVVKRHLNSSFGKELDEKKKEKREKVKQMTGRKPSSVRTAQFANVTKEGDIKLNEVTKKAGDILEARYNIVISHHQAIMTIVSAFAEALLENDMDRLGIERAIYPEKNIDKLEFAFTSLSTLNEDNIEEHKGIDLLVVDLNNKDTQE